MWVEITKQQVHLWTAFFPQRSLASSKCRSIFIYKRPIFVTELKPCHINHFSVWPNSAGRLRLFDSSPFISVITGSSGCIQSSAGGSRNGRRGRIGLHMCTHIHTYTHIHTKPSDLPCFFQLHFDSFYMTFSNSCMDLIMFSSCGEIEDEALSHSVDCQFCWTMRFIDMLQEKKNFKL